MDDKPATPAPGDEDTEHLVRLLHYHHAAGGRPHFGCSCGWEGVAPETEHGWRPTTPHQLAVLLASQGCEKYYAGTCHDGRSATAHYGADQQCAPCIASAVLGDHSLSDSVRMRESLECGC
jgi:hypothetical protein